MGEINKTAKDILADIQEMKIIDKVINSIDEFKSLTDEQNAVICNLIKTANAGATLDPEELKIAREVLNTLTREQISVVYALIAALSRSQHKNAN